MVKKGTIIRGYCKDCGSEIYEGDRIPEYLNVYECSKCGHPHSKDELRDEVPSYLKKEIEKSVIYKGSYVECPTCGGKLSYSDQQFNRCKYCDQNLRWVDIGWD